MVVTRFAPSPTGFLHSGNYRTALFSYLYAKKHQGRFLVRIEDTDKARSKKEYEDNILESLSWLGLSYEKLYRQSERTEIYKTYLKKLIDEGKAFVSQETEGERKEVIRFKNPNKKVVFHDLIRGDIEMDTTDLGDFVIARSMEEPVFHLVVVIDDFEMGITHIVRGEDHISNTPRHILIQEAIGAPIPTYAHLPLILAKDRSKLSKRKGALPLTEYRDMGYVKEAVINYLAMLGWNPGTDKELFALDDLVSEFSLEKVQKSGAIFDEEKLKWFNKQYINKMSLEDFKKVSLPFITEKEIPLKLWPILKERTTILSELKDLSEFDFIKTKPNFPKEKLNWKEKIAKKEILEQTKDLIKSVDDFTKENVKAVLWPLTEKEGKGEVLWPLRIALSGKDKSPDPFTLAEILGKEESISRIDYAISIL